MAINLKRSGGRTYTPTPKQGYGQRAAFNAKRACCDSGRLDMPITKVPVTTRKRRIGAPAAA